MRPEALPPPTLSQILSGFDPPPGHEASEEVRLRYWEDYYAKRQSFHQNRYRYPQDQIEQYRGRGLAWSPDGTRILAVGTDSCTLQQQINALGVEAILLAYEDVPQKGDEVFA